MNEAAQDVKQKLTVVSVVPEETRNVNSPPTLGEPPPELKFTTTKFKSESELNYKLLETVQTFQNQSLTRTYLK